MNQQKVLIIYGGVAQMFERKNLVTKREYFVP